MMLEVIPMVIFSVALLATTVLIVFLCFALAVASSEDKEKEGEEQIEYPRKWREEHTL